MLIYQVTIKVNPEIEAEWLQWMKSVHIPDVIATGLIRSYQLLKSQSEQHRYCFQYTFATKADYDHYTAEHGPALKEDVIRRYPDQFTATRELYDFV